MMDAFFTSLFEVTVTMAIIIALLLLLDPLLGKRYTAKWRYWVWMAVALRLLLPINLSLPQAPVQLERPAEQVIYTYIPPIQSTAPPSTGRTDNQAGQNQEGQLPGQSLHGGDSTPDTPAISTNPNPFPRSITLSQALFALWLLGACGFLLFHLIGYWRFRRYVARWQISPPATLCHQLEQVKASIGLSAPVELFLCPGLSGPMTTGFFRPILLLPHGAYSDQELFFIFRHELIHCKRHDLWYKALLLGANVIHWFNPLVHLMVRTAERDMELACDDAVVKGLAPSARKEYGNVLLSALRQVGAATSE